MPASSKRFAKVHGQGRVVNQQVLPLFIGFPTGSANPFHRGRDTTIQHCGVRTERIPTNSGTSRQACQGTKPRSSFGSLLCIETRMAPRNATTLDPFRPRMSVSQEQRFTGCLSRSLRRVGSNRRGTVREAGRPTIVLLPRKPKVSEHLAREKRPLLHWDARPLPRYRNGTLSDLCLTSISSPAIGQPICVSFRYTMKYTMRLRKAFGNESQGHSVKRLGSHICLMISENPGAR